MISIGFPPPPSSLSSLSPQGKQGILYANDVLWSNKELLLSYGADSFDHSQPAVCSLSPHILAQLWGIKLNKIFKNQIIAPLEEIPWRWYLKNMPHWLKVSFQHCVVPPLSWIKWYYQWHWCQSETLIKCHTLYMWGHTICSEWCFINIWSNTHIHYW